jgi:ABC-type oligopeptide transport system substrate-binding subunit
MLDAVVGGYEPAKKKLRQAVAIAIDVDEDIEIFFNGRNRRADRVLPPGIFGFSEGREAMNPFIDDWDDQTGRAKRKPIETAKRLLAEAGYPGGRDSAGKPLVLYFDNQMAGAESKSYLDWLRKQLAKIDVDLESRTTDYNRFQDKVNKGNFQIIQWGWNADYPDPENFMFLLYGPNSKVKSGSENSVNYDNPRFNALFKRMATMENTPERDGIIQEMEHIVQEEMPWIPSYNPVDFTLFHNWYMNTKAMPLGGMLKYRKVDPDLRERVREADNRPRYWPFALAVPLLAAVVAPAWIGVRRKQKRSAIS